MKQTQRMLLPKCAITSDCRAPVHNSICPQFYRNAIGPFTSSEPRTDGAQPLCPDSLQRINSFDIDYQRNLGIDQLYKLDPTQGNTLDSVNKMNFPVSSQNDDILDTLDMMDSNNYPQEVNSSKIKFSTDLAKTKVPKKQVAGMSSVVPLSVNRKARNMARSHIQGNELPGSDSINSTQSIKGKNNVQIGRVDLSKQRNLMKMPNLTPTNKRLSQKVDHQRLAKMPVLQMCPANISISSLLLLPKGTDSFLAPSIVDAKGQRPMSPPKCQASFQNVKKSQCQWKSTGEAGTVVDPLLERRQAAEKYMRNEMLKKILEFEVMLRNPLVSIESFRRSFFQSLPLFALIVTVDDAETCPDGPPLLNVGGHVASSPAVVQNCGHTTEHLSIEDWSSNRILPNVQQYYSSCPPGEKRIQPHQDHSSERFNST